MPSPGWKWVPRWRTMISPALTSWPPKRLTPRRCALESRPLRVEDAPFLCAMSAASALDAGDADLGVVLTVPLALAVTGLVLVLQDVDLRALGRAQHLGGHGDRAQGRGRREDGLAVDEHQRLQVEAGAHRAVGLVDLENVAHADLVLAAATTHDCVHA